MALDTLLVNLPEGSSQIAGKNTPNGFAEAVAVVNSAGDMVDPATEATLAGAAASLANIDTDLGAKADTPATDDAGTWSIIALFKRISAGVTSLVSRIPYIGAEAPLPVYLAGDPDGLTPNVGVSGRSPNGAQVPFSVDANGGTFPADAPEIIRVFFAGPTNAILAQGSTRGFNSLHFSIPNTINANFTLQFSMDGVFPQPAAMCVSSSGIATNIPINSGDYAAPCIGLAWRLVCNTYTSGSGVFSIALRNQTVSVPLLSAASNINQINGTTPLTGGVAGTLAVGGIGAANAATLQNPMLMGGFDGALLRRILTDTRGAQVMSGGGQPQVPGSPAIFDLPASSAAGLGVAEVLNWILIEMRVQTTLMRELPTVLNSPNGFFDELDSLRNDVASTISN